jgi:HAD superfamily hydrolase (TIGR01509 family)
MIMKKVELVIFDCDGVLVDSETITNVLMIEMLEPHGVFFTREEYVQRYVGITLEDCISQICEEFKITLPDSFIKDYLRVALIRLQLYVEEIDGIQDLLRRIPMPFCVASNSPESKVRLMLETTHLLKHFDGKIFSASQVSNPKPAPDVYLLAAAKNGVDPKDCLVIEDTPTGVRAGKAAGMTVYGFAGLFPPETLLQAGADNVFYHMEQLFAKTENLRINSFN